MSHDPCALHLAHAGGDHAAGTVARRCGALSLDKYEAVGRCAAHAELLASGARVGFGCDGEASSANRDLLREARLGSYLQKVRTLDPTVLPAGQCYAMLTEQGMRALGYRDVGRIAEGWQADFSLVRTETCAR